MVKSRCATKRVMGNKSHLDPIHRLSIGSGKQKESKDKAPESPEECALSFPDLGIIDKCQLPVFYQVLGRSKDECIMMEDLDRLQLDLETLLNNVAVRIQDMSREIATLNTADERRDKTIKLSLNTKKKAEERTPREPAGKSRLRIGTLDDPTFLGGREGFGGFTDHTKVALPKNDTVEKFWNFVEPYCAEITEEDVKFLKELKASCEKEAEPQKIPPLGRHYTMRWADEDAMDEQACSPVTSWRQNFRQDVRDSLKKTNKMMIREKIPGSLVQQLVSALVEENYMKPEQETDFTNRFNLNESGELQAAEEPCKSTEKKSPGDQSVPSYIKKLPTYHTSTCFDLNLQKELEGMGFLDSEESKDEILEDIKLCQEEIKTNATHLVEQLERIIKKAELELEKNKVRKQMRAVEQEIIEASKKVQTAKEQKQPLTKEEEEHIMKLIRTRSDFLSTLKAME